MEAETILSVENQTKIFGQVVANDCISFDIRRGEVHCLLGENGAGKSTLAKCLYGAYRPDTGQIFLKGYPTHFSSPGDAIKAGIGMVHQHFVLAAPLTSLENIIVGTESGIGRMDLRKSRQKVQALCQAYQIELDLDAPVSTLSTGKQQWVEILKALYVGIEILILDEPTAVLTPQETEKLFHILRKMTGEGFSIVLITHKLQEVINISDRVTVLRKGRVVNTCDTRQITKQDLAHMMVGRDVSFQLDKPEFQDSAPALELRRVSLNLPHGQNLLCDINLQIHHHEIVGLAGVAGNGQQDLFDLLVGVRRPDIGTIHLEGKEIHHLSPQQRMQRGLASIPPDRIAQGLLMDFTVQENMILGFQRASRFSSGPFISSKKVNAFAEESILKYDIATPGPLHKAGFLSGGNLQKVILAREFSRKNSFLVASSPTRGLDIGATEFVHQRLVELRNQGAGILLISEDLDEIFSLSDRIAVIYKGEIMGILTAKSATIQKVGFWMAGIRDGVQ
jgi:general nucleoside transport system ATP-binding protein